MYKAEDDKAVLSVFRDDYSCDNPRDWDNLGTMVCWHRRYSLGDKHNFDSPEDFFFSLAEDIVGDTDKVERVSWERIKDLVMKNVIMLPLYLYDHSGITMSTSSFSCPWDSGQVGWIYVTKEKLREEYGVKFITKNIREKALKALEDEVKEYDCYLTGEVYGFRLEKKVYRQPCEPGVDCCECDSCPEYELEEVASVYGFYGTDWKINGLNDHIPNEYKYLVDKLEYCY